MSAEKLLVIAYLCNNVHLLFCVCPLFCCRQVRAWTCSWSRMNLNPSLISRFRSSWNELAMAWMQVHFLRLPLTPPWKGRVSSSIRQPSAFIPNCARSSALRQRAKGPVDIGSYRLRTKMFKWLMSLEEATIWTKMLLNLVNKSQMCSIMLLAKFSPFTRRPRKYKVSTSLVVFWVSLFALGQNEDTKRKEIEATSDKSDAALARQNDK